jgi:hypothetical protein
VCVSGCVCECYQSTPKGGCVVCMSVCVCGCVCECFGLPRREGGAYLGLVLEGEEVHLSKTGKVCVVSLSECV